MPLVRTFAVAALLGAAAASGHAMEATTHNDVRNMNSGLEQRLEAMSASLQAAFNALRAQVEGFATRISTLEATATNHEGRITTLETQMSSLRTWQQAAQAWMHQTAGHISDIFARLAALEARQAAKVRVAYKGELKIENTNTRGEVTSNQLTADFCTIRHVYILSTADNHYHGCTMEQDGNKFRMKANGGGGGQTTYCYAICYELMQE